MRRSYQAEQRTQRLQLTDGGRGRARGAPHSEGAGRNGKRSEARWSASDRGKDAACTAWRPRSACVPRGRRKLARRPGRDEKRRLTGGPHTKEISRI
jgi:hypothetical protein